jgi:hypothetical protein
MAKQMMPYMHGYTTSYTPPSGNAGSEAVGEYSHKSNPRPIPKKGSSIREMSAEYGNSDRNKVMRLQGEQKMQENLRGKGC